MMSKRTIAIALSSLLLASAAAWAAVVTVTQDGGFESGTPNAFWDEASTNFGTPLCTVGSCGTGTGTGPHSGNWWAWFGGISAAETGHMYQSVVIPSGTGTLSFWLEARVSAGNPADFLAVSIDDSELFRLAGDATGPYANYTQVTLDVSGFADGGAHMLKFDSTINGTGTTNFFVDDVSLDVETKTCASEGYTGTKLEWCKNICERDYTGSTLAMWIRRWTERYRTLPYCALEPQPVPTAR
jgi:hypothetical protein